MINKNNILKAKHRSLLVSEWCCAVRFNKNEKNCLLEDSDGSFTVLKNSIRYWTADPFIFKYKGEYYLFFEAFDRLKRKGVIGYRKISEKGAGRIKICYESAGHLSYPFIFEKNNHFYIVPESSEENELFLLESVGFPDKWKKTCVLTKGEMVDTVFFEDKNNTYCLTEKIIEKFVFDRLDLFYFENDSLVECENNPVKTDANYARGAGKLFYHKGKRIRPSQNCGKNYGEKLNFNEVLSVSKLEYKEKCVKTISASDIKTNKSTAFSGIHTYNRLDHIEVIDLKMQNQFHLLNLLGAVIKRIKASGREK